MMITPYLLCHVAQWYQCFAALKLRHIYWQMKIPKSGKIAKN
jgi:hypothetical protein